MAKTLTHVARVLDEVDTEGALQHFATRIVRASKRGGPAARSIAVVERWIISQARTRYGADFDLRRPPRDFARDARDVAAMLYLLVEVWRPQAFLLDTHPKLLQRKLDNVENDFFAILVDELHQREAIHPGFAADMERARAQVEAISRRVEDELNEAAPASIDGSLVEDDDGLPKVVFAALGPELLVLAIVIGCVLLFYWTGHDSDPDTDDDDE